MATLTIGIDTSGPLLTGSPGAVVRAMVDEVLSEIADQASADVHNNLDLMIRHPTPYYETQIRRFKRGRVQLVGDRGVIYGPWLEGTGSRNRTTRFKGYASFRLAVQDVQRRVPSLADHVVKRHMGRLQ